MEIKPVLEAAGVSNLAEAAGWTIATLLGGILGFQKMRRQYGTDKVAAESNSAQLDILELMRKEIDRLSAQNTLLLTTVHSLQMEVIALRMENAEIKAHIFPRTLPDGKQISAPAA